jgi:hypothetical protein
VLHYVDVVIMVQLTYIIRVLAIICILSLLHCGTLVFDVENLLFLFFCEEKSSFPNVISFRGFFFELQIIPFLRVSNTFAVQH